MEGAKSEPQICSQCSAQLVEGARFCSECGSQVSFKTKASAWAQKLKHRTKTAINEFKMSLDHQISDYLRQIDSGNQVSIGGITVPEGRKSGVRNAMVKFQNKFLEGDAGQESDYETWLSELPQRLDEHNCIVCFSKWDASDVGNIVVCPHCHSGGHRNHIVDWIKTKNYCPLCRESVNFSEYVLLK